MVTVTQLEEWIASMTETEKNTTLLHLAADAHYNIDMDQSLDDLKGYINTEGPASVGRLEEYEEDRAEDPNE